jgi:hypothetical protein
MTSPALMAGAAPARSDELARAARPRQARQKTAPRVPLRARGSAPVGLHRVGATRPSGKRATCEREPGHLELYRKASLKPKRFPNHFDNSGEAS